MLDFDTVVIGSGMGGLTCALALARAGEKVGIFEQHDVPGGWCHSFHRGGFRYSPGIHYLGQTAEGGALRRTLEGLGVAKDLVLFELNPQGFEHIRAGDVAFDIPAGREAFAEALSARFPREAQGIREYLGLLQTVRDELLHMSESLGVRDTLAVPYRMRNMGRFGLYSLQRILRDRIGDQRARGILSVQCGDHGLPPSKVPFALHAAVAGHYLEGGVYPRGGGAGLVKAFTRALGRHGATLRTRSPVRRILLEGRRAVGIALEDGTQVRARRVVSNADPFITYGQLVGPEQLPWGLRRKLRRSQTSISALSLFLALDLDLRQRGFDSGNYWISDTTDADEIYTAMARPDVLDRPRLPGAFLTVTTLKDPTSFDGRHHVLEAFAFTPYEPFLPFASSPHGERDPGYLELKERLTQKLLDLVATVIPDVRQHIQQLELGTPLTNAFYVQSTRGAIYGTEKSLWHIGPFAFGNSSPFPGLTLVGASTQGHGIHGTSLSGLSAAAKLLGCRPSELLTDTTPLTVTPADLQGEDQALYAPRVRQVSAG